MRWRGLTMAAMAAGLMLTACTRSVYVPMESVRTERIEADTTAIYERLRSFFESMYHSEASSDSVIDRSRETVVLKENGDTARHDKERVVYVSSRREKELEHKISQRDSIIDALRAQLELIKVDSARVPYPVAKELTRWEQAKMDFGGMAMGGFAITLCIAVAWLIKKFRR